jgi:hypothetical protein
MRGQFEQLHGDKSAACGRCQMRSKLLCFMRSFELSVSTQVSKRDELTRSRFRSLVFEA